MNIEDAIYTVNTILGPNYINDVQELIFRECWLGKTYQEIANTSGYTHDHIRTVGSHLWQSLSEALGEKTTKSNFHAVLKRHSLQQPAQKAEVLDSKSLHTPGVMLELPTGPVSINSHFYIEREPIETHCYEIIRQPGALIRIKAPRQMGKTSLMARILHYAQAQGYQTVVMSMRQASLRLFENSNRLLSWFCSDVTYRLGQPDKLNQYWDEILGGNSNSTRYFEDYLLSELSSPLVLAIDDADVVFRYPEIATDFLGLLRSWYEKSRYGLNTSEVWQKLRLIIVHSTEVYISLPVRQSPFNVGFSINLPEFTPAQVKELAIRYSLIKKSHIYDEESSSYIALLMEQVGGNPFLIRSTFHYLYQNHLTLKQLFDSDTLIFDIHQEILCQKLQILQQYPKLVKAYKEIVHAPHPVQLNPQLTFELQSLGLVKTNEHGISPSCLLYAKYFANCPNQIGEA